MKKIEAIIRSSKFESVKTGLSGIGINFFTFFEVKGYGKQPGDHVVYRGAAYDVGYIARLKIEVFATIDQTSKIVETIREAAHTGEIGDGKITILPVDEFVSIRTGKINKAAL